MTEPIKSMAVKVLGLPQEISAQLQAIANSGGGADLDTDQELEEAKALLAKISLGLQQTITHAVTKLEKVVPNPTQPRINERAVTVIENGVPYRYTIDALTSWGESGGILHRENMRTGEKTIVYQDVHGCASPVGKIKKVATDGENVYVLFNNPSANESLRIGKVEAVEGGEYRIRFVDIQHLGLGKTIKDFLVEGGRLYAAGNYDYLATPVLFGLGGAETFGQSESCRF